MVGVRSFDDEIHSSENQERLDGLGYGDQVPGANGSVSATGSGWRLTREWAKGAANDG
jgi:hypothetical protein